MLVFFVFSGMGFQCCFTFPDIVAGITLPVLQVQMICIIVDDKFSPAFSTVEAHLATVRISCSTMPDIFHVWLSRAG